MKGRDSEENCQGLIDSSQDPKSGPNITNGHQQQQQQQQQQQVMQHQNSNTNSSNSIEQLQLISDSSYIATDSNNSQPERKYRPQKFCAVCGDRAIACNFNAVTCESCKAFFRRNAFKERMKCLFEDKCVIDKVTRRFCSRCRLKKCFEIGMKREWILSEDEKEKKRIKIMQNRQKKARSSSSADTRENQSDNDCYDESSPNSSSLQQTVISVGSNCNSISSNGNTTSTTTNTTDNADISATSSISITTRQQRNVYTCDASTSCPDDVDLVTGAGPGLWCMHNCSYCYSFYQPTAHMRCATSVGPYSSVGPMPAMKSSIPGPDYGYVQLPIDPTTINGFSSSGHANNNAPSGGHHTMARFTTFVQASSQWIASNQSSHSEPIFVSSSPTSGAIVHRDQSISNGKGLEGLGTANGVVIGNMGAAGSINNNTQHDQGFMNMILKNVDHLYDQEVDSHGNATTEPVSASVCECRQDNDQSCPQQSCPHANVSDLGGLMVANIGLCGASLSEEHNQLLPCDIEPVKPTFKYINDEATNMTFTIPCTSDEEVELRLSMCRFFPNETARMEEILNVTRKVMFEHHPIDSLVEKGPAALRSLMRIFEWALKRIISAVKLIRSFRELTIDDQITLIKTHCFKIMLVRSAFHYDDDIKGWLDQRTGRKLDLSGLQILQKSPVWDRHFEFLHNFDRYMRKDRIIVTLLLSVIVFDASSVTAQLKHRYSIHLEHVTYLGLLKKYITETQPDPLTKYERLMGVLSLLNVANEEYTRFFAQNPRSDVSPLILEIFDIGSI